MFSLLAVDYTVDKIFPIIKWVTVGVLIAFILACVLTYFIKKTAFNKTVKLGFLLFTVFALIVGIVMLVFEILKHYDKAYLEEKWVSLDIINFVFLPILITLSIALILFVLGYFLLKKEKNIKPFKWVSVVSLGVAVIVTIVLIAIYYSRNISGDGYYTAESSKFNSLALYIFSAILIIGLVVTAFLVDKNKLAFTTKSIATAGVCTALSFGLSFIKFEGLWLQGGSITLFSMLPIMLYSYAFGMKKGLIVGLIYGLLQAVQDPYIVHPAQFLLDYPLAFAMTAFSGVLNGTKIFNNIPQLKFGISAFIGGFFRAFSHVLAGVFAFGAYAVGEGATNFLAYSIVYNSYVFIDVALVIIGGAILFSSKGFCLEVEKLNANLLETYD